MAIRIDRDICAGCGSCVGSCPNGAISLQDGKAVISDGCVSCGMCVTACPLDAISSVREGDGRETALCDGLWVYAEQRDGVIPEVAYQLLGKGRELADAMGTELTAVVIGSGLKELDSLIQRGADRVLAVDAPEFGTPLELPYSEALIQLIRERRPAAVLYGATAFGRAMAPRVAAALRTGLTADCTMLDIDPDTGLLRQTRPAFGGNLMATIICPEARPQMATVRPGIMKALESQPDRKGVIEYAGDVSLPELCGAVKLLSTENEAAGDNIADYDILVVAGKGIGSKKNMKYVKRLAELLHGNYGVSRPLIDAGWAEYPHQVGQTGCSVSPKLLISLGVSGAIQHLAGISGAERIVAVNTDPDAAIFNVASYAVIGDCVEFACQMIAKLEEAGEKQ